MIARVLCFGLVEDGGSSLHSLNEEEEDGVSSLHSLNEEVEGGGSSLHSLN